MADLHIDRDEVEDAVDAAFSPDGEVTGAGSGIGRCHLDLEIAPGVDRDQALERLRNVLTDLGIAGSAEIIVRD